MLIVISPAKRLDWATREVDMTAPRFHDEARALAQTARGLSAADLSDLMDISPALAELNAERFQQFAQDADDLRPAVLAFAGDTYQGLEAASLDADDLRFAQDRLSILSGLYGVLRPLDAIRPYRLEMGSRLATEKGPNLYAYWGDKLAFALNAQAHEMRTDTLINCASVEYFSAVDRDALSLRVITPQFLEDKPGGPKIVSFHAKKARGAMARFIITRRLTDPAAIFDFDLGGYVYAPALSTAEKPAFLRSADAASASAA
ncbi:peroxide stress protein YaaA [Roseicyclus sp.]|uniref:peroxide stress protein YaaA n=1 Tax=Roseicyclus sp. TaxID=1914329 RepID=UPI003F6D50CE